MKLKKVQIEKYKCIESKQTFDIEDDITILVGMNESGKTSILEAIAKSNYFQDDEKFKFNKTHDYPRKEKKALDKSGNNPDAIVCTFEIPDNLIVDIENDLGKKVLLSSEITRVVKYDNSSNWYNIKTDYSQFIKNKTKELGINSDAINNKLLKVKSAIDLENIISEYKDPDYLGKLKSFEPYFKDEWEWRENLIGEYIGRVYLSPNLPKFLYYDEYYSLPSRISIEELQNDSLDEEELKTAKALFDLADINVKELISANDFENYKAELEATEATITEVLFKYWQTNKNLDIVFDIDKIEKNHPQQGTRIVEHVLDIRVKNNRSRVSLPLKNRSKGFNWFFSFLVWFKKIQEDTSSNYILLLDEPGLNLHASAQNDLLRFIEDLSKNYQIIYTSHSPFMIPSSKLQRVRTVVETKDGAIISDSIQEKDPNTLFPLQAALGYDIAQNLFISEKNLLVEGVSDLIYIQTLSSILESEKRQGLRNDITIVPTGGLDKVSTFISLMRGSKLKVVCLLDTMADQRGKAKLDDLIKHRIINQNRIRFFHEYLDGYTYADIEDLFDKEDYLSLFNSAFHEHKNLALTDLNQAVKPINIQIKQILNLEHINHYRPANHLAKIGADSSYFKAETLNNFEKVLTDINKLFD